MAIEHIGLAQVVSVARHRACIKRQPRVFFGWLIATYIIVPLIAFGAWEVYVYQQPLARRVQTLVSDQVKIGGFLGFYQSSAPVRRCPQETSRVIWKWNDAKNTRIAWPIGDHNLTPPLWGGKSIIYLKIPEDLRPGAYYYVRETYSYCTLWSWMLGLPAVDRTVDVPFTVVE